IMTPPGRVLAFNPAINHNDGLLASSYALRMQLPVEEAGKALAADVSDMRHALESDGRVTIGRHGDLMLDNGSYSFIAADKPQWLPEIKLRSIIDMARDDSKAAEMQSAIAKSERIGSALRKLKIAASIAVILALGFVLSTPTPIDNAQFASPVVEQFRLKAPGPERILRQPGQQSGTLMMQAPADCQAVIMADTAGINAYKAELRQKAETARRQKTEAAATRQASEGRYCLVVASLNNGEEARKFLSANSSMPLHVLEKDGHYRIYAISGNSIGEVKNLANESGLLSRFPGAWVCRK
ncbi:MAG: hypothetical protein K2H03_00445, partial [Muribaculaceae bacterium]|nr:hypothetical protein [Muribaculaceae bacterium]